MPALEEVQLLKFHVIVKKRSSFLAANGRDWRSALWKSRLAWYSFQSSNKAPVHRPISAWKLLSGCSIECNLRSHIAFERSKMLWFAHSCSQYQKSETALIVFLTQSRTSTQEERSNFASQIRNGKRTEGGSAIKAVSSTRIEVIPMLLAVLSIYVHSLQVLSCLLFEPLVIHSHSS